MARAESSFVAIECAGRATVSVDVVKGRTLRAPQLDTDAYVVMSALAHSELGGPTGSVDPDPLHPFRPVGAVTLARMAKDVLLSAGR